MRRRRKRKRKRRRRRRKSSSSCTAGPRPVRQGDLAGGFLPQSDKAPVRG